MGEFRDLLEAAAKRYASKREFAKAIGITPGRLSRVLGGEHSFEVGNCLTLARLTGESPSRVLRVAGKGDIADAIEALYGPAAPSVSPKDRAFLDAWNRLTERAREGLQLTMSELARAGADAIRQPGVPESSTTAAAHGGSANKRSGRTLAEAPPVHDGQIDPVSGASRQEVSRLAAGVLGLTRAAEQASGVDKPARAARAVGEHAPAPRPPQPAHRARVRKRGR